MIKPTTAMVSVAIGIDSSQEPVVPMTERAT